MVKCSVPQCTEEAVCTCPKKKLRQMSDEYWVSEEILAKSRSLCVDHREVARGLAVVGGVSFRELSTKPVEVKTLTGLSLDTFRLLLEFARMFSTKVKIVYSGRNKTALPIGYEDQLLITLTKLRTGNTDKELSAYFELPVTTINESWKTWLDLLYRKFRPLMKVPSLEVCQKTMPTGFKKFPNTRIIVDCTEIPIEPPSELARAAACYSYYKENHTAKLLVGVIPCGTIVFVSQCFPGSATDKQITSQCGVLSALNPGDGVMADKGFLIEGLLPDGVQLNVPCGLWKKKTFTKEEIRRSKEISKARIHVERAIKVMKDYKILQGRVPNKLLQTMDHIVLVVAMLSNMQDPIIREVMPLLQQLEGLS